MFLIEIDIVDREHRLHAIHSACVVPVAVTSMDSSQSASPLCTTRVNDASIDRRPILMCVCLCLCVKTRCHRVNRCGVKRRKVVYIVSRPLHALQRIVP